MRWLFGAAIPLIYDDDSVDGLVQIDCYMTRTIRVIAIAPIAIEGRNDGARQDVWVVLDLLSLMPRYRGWNVGHGMYECDALPVAHKLFFLHQGVCLVHVARYCMVCPYDVLG